MTSPRPAPRGIEPRVAFRRCGEVLRNADPLRRKNRCLKHPAMLATVTDAVHRALPDWSHSNSDDWNVDVEELERDLLEIAEQWATARALGLSLDAASNDRRFPLLVAFHRGLTDALFVELPHGVRQWIAAGSPSASNIAGLSSELVGVARGGAPWPELPRHDDPSIPGSTAASANELQTALAELLIFESIRLRLLATAWSSEEFEALGGDERDVDAIAWNEVRTMLADPSIDDPEVRPLRVMYAAASLALARDAADRADDLRVSAPAFREQLRMRARLRSALRELRVADAVLLENALSNLLGNERVELTQLQSEHPVALDGLTRQAMDQRVSRGRKALARRDETPRRRAPALFDLLRGPAANDNREAG